MQVEQSAPPGFVAHRFLAEQLQRAGGQAMSAAGCMSGYAHYRFCMTRQMSFEFRPTGRGGARPGAGRPRGSRRSPRIPHTSRPLATTHRPHHVTIKMNRATWNLRSQRGLAPIRRALALARKREGFRVVAFSVQHDHLHLVTEACDRVRLSNALRALVSRIARGLNLAMRTRGPRVADRYHEHILKTPTEVLNVLRYVLGNRALHRARLGRAPDHGELDPYSSLAQSELAAAPVSWLLRIGWMRAPPGREPPQSTAGSTRANRISRQTISANTPRGMIHCGSV